MTAGDDGPASDPVNAAPAARETTGDRAELESKAAEQRPAFDSVDAALAARTLNARGLTAVDPFAEEAAKGDLIFTVSLEHARFMVRQSFGLVNARGLPFRAYPVLVGRPSANAFAAEQDGLQLCGMEIGLGTAAFEIGLFVFAQATLFTEIGRVEEEQSPSLPAGSRLAFWISDRLRERGTADGAAIGLELMPKHADRQLAAYLLTQLMLRFVWLHEHYHCLNGHTGLLASERPGAVLNEMPDEAALDLIETESPQDAAQHQRLRHAMEFDADRSALWMLVRMQQIDLEPIVALAAWPKSRRLKLAIFAAVMMTFLFDQAAGRQTQRTGATHPLPKDRLVDLVRTLGSNLTDPPGEVKQAFAAVLAEMTALQDRLPQFVSAERLLHDIRSTPLQRALDEIDDELTAARTRFAPFAYRAPGP